MMLRYHPDRNDSADARETTQQLNHAYEVLSDPVKRAAYDKEISVKTGPGQENPGAAASSHSTSHAESSFRLQHLLPSRAWLTGIVGAFAIATFMVVVGPAATDNPFSWLFGDEDVLKALNAEVADDTNIGSNGEIAAFKTPNSVADPQEAPSSLSPATMPAATVVPLLTAREIFILESNGEITPSVAALLLRLINQNRSPTLEQAGAITVAGVTPTVEVCRYVDCVGGTIPTGRNDEITLNATVEPISPIADEYYMVWLADLDGSTLDTERVRWSSRQLGDDPVGEDADRVKLVALPLPEFDISVSNFITDYNSLFLSELKRFEDEAIIECSLSIGPDGSLIVGNLECADQVQPSFQLKVEQIAAALGRHFMIELMLESEFIERGLKGQ